MEIKLCPLAVNNLSIYLPIYLFAYLLTGLLGYVLISCRCKTGYKLYAIKKISDNKCENDQYKLV